jgi:hypothetical protein
LWIPPDNILPILAQLMPIIGNINLMSIWNFDLMGFVRSGVERNNAASQLLTTMLTKARILQIEGGNSVTQIANSKILRGYTFITEKGTKNSYEINILIEYRPENGKRNSQSREFTNVKIFLKFIQNRQIHFGRSLEQNGGNV